MAKSNPDLFDDAAKSASKAYTAKDIEVLEGLEPVRPPPRHVYRRHRHQCAASPGRPKSSTNAMDEAVAGHATTISLELRAGNVLVVRDNGRGIPVDPHPKFKNKSALEVIMTTLHAGGKFDGKAYGDLGRPAWRGLVGGERFVGMAGSGSGARPPCLEDAFRARARRWQAERPGGGQPARHHRVLQARRKDLRRYPVLARAAAPHGQVQGLSVPWRGNPLVLRSPP